MIVETDLFWEDRENPKATFEAVRKYFPKAKALTTEQILQGPLPNANQSFRGSLALAKKMGRAFEYANVLNWLPHFKKYAVNDEYTFMDFQSVVENANRNGIGRGIFVRPVSGFKEFSGQAFTSVGKLEEEFRFLTANRNISPFIICQVSPLREVKGEVRHVFVDRKLISSSSYSLTGEPRNVDEFIGGSQSRAKYLAEDPYFDNKWEFVIDIAETENCKFKLVEINAFETASFYACDLDAIYEAWSKTFENAR